MEKDLGLAVDIAAKMKCRVPLGSNAHQLYGMLSDHGYVSVSLLVRP
jgi:3-hydroxyisobutyrate dehydrogenase-like beta-hydroxyacid dehydrogenase